MPTPQELRKISEGAAKRKAEREELEKVKREEEKVKHEKEMVLLIQMKAEAAIDHAEANMTKAAEEGLSAALVYLIEPHEVAEASLRSLSSGAKVDSPDRFFCAGSAQIVFNHFKSNGFNVVIVSQPVPAPRPEDPPHHKYYIKVGW